MRVDVAPAVPFEQTCRGSRDSGADQQLCVESNTPYVYFPCCWVKHLYSFILVAMSNVTYLLS